MALYLVYECDGCKTRKLVPRAMKGLTEGGGFRAGLMQAVYSESQVAPPPGWALCDAALLCGVCQAARFTQLTSPKKQGERV